LSECHELALNAAHLPVGFLHGGGGSSRVKSGMTAANQRIGTEMNIQMEE
jgi:hypothetical protein